MVHCHNIDSHNVEKSKCQKSICGMSQCRQVGMSKVKMSKTDRNKIVNSKLVMLLNVTPIWWLQHCGRCRAESDQCRPVHSFEWGYWFVCWRLHIACVSVVQNCRQLSVRVLDVDWLLWAQEPLRMTISWDDGIQCCAETPDANPLQSCSYVEDH